MLATDGTDVLIAAIGCAGIVLAASVPAIFLWLGQRDIKARIGVPNGKGPLSEMNEKQLSQLAEIRAEQAAHQELDTQRFRLLHQHLNLPFEETP